MAFQILFMMIKREVFTTIMQKFPHLKYKPDLRTGIENSNMAYDFFPVQAETNVKAKTK